MPPAGRAGGNRRSAAAAVLESTEVTPILDSFRAGNNAEIRAAIYNAFSVGDDDVEAVVVGVDNSDGYSDDLFGVVDGHSYFGDHRNPNPEDPSGIEGPRPLTSPPIAHRHGWPSSLQGWLSTRLSHAGLLSPSGYRDDDDDNDNPSLFPSIELSTIYERPPVGGRHDDAIPADATTTTMRRQRRRWPAIQRTTIVTTSRSSSLFVVRFIAGHTRAVCDVANDIRKGDTIGGWRMSDGNDPRTMNTTQQSTKNSRGRLRR